MSFSYTNPPSPPPQVSDFAGRHVKEADGDICAHLKVSYPYHIISYHIITYHPSLDYKLEVRGIHLLMMSYRVIPSHPLLD